MNRPTHSSSNIARPAADSANIVRLIEKEGANINRIARILREHKESVRYRYKQRILANGFKIQAKPNHERLGLKRLVLTGNLESNWWDHYLQLFTLLNETGYFVGFFRILPDSRLVANVSIPSQFIPDLERLLSALASRHILHVKRIYSFDWFRQMPMLAQYYDFSVDRWDFDWRLSRGENEGLLNVQPSTMGRFQYTDLLLIKELQLDAARPLSEIAEKLRLSYKTALRHFHHIVEEGLIHGYLVNWLKTGFDPKRAVIPVIRHKYLPLFLLVNNITPSEARHLRLTTERLPYLYSEALGKDYFAEVILPLDQSIEGLQYLRELLGRFRERADFGLVDPEYSLGFTVSYQLYNWEANKWIFDHRSVIERIEILMGSRRQVTE